MDSASIFGMPVEINLSRATPVRTRCVLAITDCGIPFRSACCWNTRELTGKDDAAITTVSHGAWPVRIPFYGNRVLPLIPLWPGFALNTPFYAAIAWGLWQVPLCCGGGPEPNAGRACGAGTT